MVVVNILMRINIQSIDGHLRNLQFAQWRITASLDFYLGLDGSYSKQP